MDARLICVIGGGISGLAFAALHRKNGGKVLVVEKNGANLEEEDGKSVIISARSLEILKRAGVETDAAPVDKIRVYFQDAPGGMDIAGGVLAYGIPHREVRQKLTEAAGECAKAGAVKSISRGGGGVRVIVGTSAGEEVVDAAAAVVACELPELPPPFCARALDFGQAVLSFRAEAKNIPAGLAVEGFTRGGIAALVPRTDGKTGVVVCADESYAGRLSALEDGALVERVNDFFGGEFGLHSPSARRAYAPRARHVFPLSSGNIAVLGAGAAVLHPAGAQGLNMGLADAECLSSALSGGFGGALASYSRRRTPAHWQMLAATGALGLGGHLRQFPFRVAGGLGAAALSAAVFPFRRNFAEFIAGKR